MAAVQTVARPICFVLFIAFALQGCVPQEISEPPTSSSSWVPVVFTEDVNPTHQKTTYRIRSSNSKSVCPVSGPGSVVLLQPTPTATGGSFSVLGLDQALFRVSHRRQCQPPEIGDCDQLWIELIADVHERGHYLVRYSPANGNTPYYTRVLYGPPRVSFKGVLPADGPLSITQEGITFELRGQYDISDTAMVCTSQDGVHFNQSTYLEARTNKPDPECLAATEVLFSQPYVIEVTLDESASVSDLTEQQLAVTFGDCSLTSRFTSEPISIVGAVAADRVTTAEAPDTGGTTGPDITGSGSEAAPTTNTDITSSQQPSSTGTGVLIGVFCAIVVILILLLLAWLVFYVTRQRRKGRADIEKQADKAAVDPPVRRNEDKVDGAVANTHPSSSKESSTGTVSTSFSTSEPSPPTVEALNTAEAPQVLNVGIANRLTRGSHMKERGRGGSLSETESEGSEVALLKELVDHTGKIIKKVDCIVQQGRDTAKAVDYIATHTDQANINSC